jgi:predicted ArsR family transcriptional regulator
MPSRGLFDRLQEELVGREKAAGLSMADVLDLPDPLRGLVNWMLRQAEVGLDDVAAYLQHDEDAARATLATLADKGFVRVMEVRGQPRYRVRLAAKRGRELPTNLWQVLDDKTSE